LGASALSAFSFSGIPLTTHSPTMSRKKYQRIPLIFHLRIGSLFGGGLQRKIPDSSRDKSIYLQISHVEREEPWEIFLVI
ncbi:MAG: hypothetical protein O0W99_00095, partial [Methanocorpusculum sp.]|nr:hypothetical protein [Methanocorpusculum sp.]